RGDTLFCSHAAQYQWFYNNNVVAPPAGNDSFLVATQWGSYAVQITDVGCSRLSDAVTVSVEELAGGRWQLAVYPNPADESIVISHQSLGSGSINIYNVLGEKIYNHQLEAGSKQETVNCKPFAKGIY